MPWAAAAAAGAAIVGSSMQAGAASDAANAQSGAANQNAQLQQQQMLLNQYFNRPYQGAGKAALYKLSSLTGIDPGEPQAPSQEPFIDHIHGKVDEAGWLQAQEQYVKERDLYNQQKAAGGFGGNDSDPNSLLHRFGAEDLNANLAPNWQFAMQQGQGAAQNAANASGGMLSGNTLKGLQDYTIGKSGDLYQQAYQNYTANQSNIFNRLSAIAGIGQTANQSVGSLNAGIANNYGNAIQQGAQAQASGAIGQANAIAGGINNAAGWYTLNNLTNKQQPSSKPENTAQPFFEPTGGAYAPGSGGFYDP